MFFKFAGAAVGLYVVYALAAGEIYARRGLWGAIWKRAEQPLRYWSGVVAYAILAVALIFWF
jgi:hypothetical protein